MRNLVVTGFPGPHAHWYLDGAEYIVSTGRSSRNSEGWDAKAWPTNGSGSSILVGPYLITSHAVEALELKMRGWDEDPSLSKAELATPVRANWIRRVTEWLKRAD